MLKDDLRIVKQATFRKNSGTKFAFTIYLFSCSVLLKIQRVMDGDSRGKWGLRIDNLEISEGFQFLRRTRFVGAQFGRIRHGENEEQGFGGG